MTPPEGFFSPAQNKPSMIINCLKNNMNSNEIFGKQTFTLSEAVMDRALAGYRKHDPVKREIVRQLSEFKCFKQHYKPESVAIDKLLMPPSNDPHDYYSQGAYWFPDPDKPDGLPYINRDGELNPEAVDPNNDNNRKKRMFTSIYSRSVLYFFTRNETHAAKAVELIRYWFLLPESKMNPNLNFGQAIPGICTGRDAGIIEFHFLIKIIDAISMLETSRHWSKADGEGMKQWMSEFLDWLRDSRIGQDENMAPNNHGAWYTVLCLKLASWRGKNKLIKEYIDTARQKMAVQIMPDGSMPNELKRTQPWGYSIFGASAFLAAAVIALDHGEDLFNYRPRSGAGVKSSIDFLAGFASGEKEWTYPEMYGFVPEKLTPILHMSAFYYQDDRYLNILEKMPEYEDAASKLFFS